MLDIAVHANGAAMYQAPDARGCGRLDQIAHRSRVDGAIGRSRKSRLPVDRRDVIHDLDVLGRAIQRGTIVKIADRRLDAAAYESLCLRRRPHERAHVVTTLCKHARQMAAREAAGAGN
jgi:hypothetical protein